MGVLVVASAGNESGPVDAPGNCTGVLAVAGLRNIGTKVGYSSLGPEVGIAAPAGNCVNSSGPCLRSIDTATNTGLTVPGANTYTNQINYNLGTSFSAPIVSAIAGLMRAVNANLTPTQLIARIESSATPFPQPAGLPQCPAVASDGSGECACVAGPVRRRHGECAERRQSRAEAHCGGSHSRDGGVRKQRDVRRQRQRRLLCPHHRKLRVDGDERDHL